VMHNNEYKKFSLTDFSLLSIAISYFAGAILIFANIIVRDSFESIPARFRDYCIFYILLFPIAAALIALTSNIFRKFNQGYKIKATIYSIYQILIATFYKQISNILFFDVINIVIGFAILSIILFLVTEITYYPIAYAISLRKRK
jgi:hypothetical protein